LCLNAVSGCRGNLAHVNVNRCRPNAYDERLPWSAAEWQFVSIVLLDVFRGRIIVHYKDSQQHEPYPSHCGR
jgi:hypothetical protein